jgi:predicted ATP-dependent endonuclease of OLD family
MNYHIREIRLRGDDFERYAVKSVHDDKRISSLSKINIFVGENNSGKSKFLRHLAALESLEFVPHVPLGPDWNWKKIANVVEEFRASVQVSISQQQVQEADDIVKQLSAIPNIRYLKEQASPVSDLIKLAERLKQLTKFDRVLYGSPSINVQLLLSSLRSAGETFLENLRHSPDLRKIPAYQFTKLYIPTLRGLRNLSNERDANGELMDFYRLQTETDYFRGHKPQIFTGLTLYHDVQKLLLSNLTERSRIREFQEFLSKRFFDGNPVALIPKLNNTVLDIKIGDEAERPIYHLGDGIQSIIILTFPLFMNRDKKLLLFCEEPELYLHAGLQRVLLSVFQKEFPDNQYFLTTHSNHFLDLTLDIANVSIYTFRKELDDSTDEKTARFEIENVSNEDTRSLQLLGVRNSSVFLSNCTIWVEGITDRRYFRKCLNLYQDTLASDAKRFKEDLHYSFVEYGGANITHFSFLDATSDPIVVERLCSRLFLITDEDNAKGDKAARHQELKTKLSDRYYCLHCKEVENLLTPSIIRAVVTQYETRQPEFNDFQQTDYQKVSLGRCIDEKVLKTPRTRKTTYAKDNTLRDKVDFCAKAVEAMKSLDDLSPEAIQIAKLLYRFIAENNQ